MEALLLEDCIDELKYLGGELTNDDLESKSLKELEQYLSEDNSLNTRALSSAYIMLYLFKHEVDSNTIDLLVQIHKFIRGRPEYETKLYNFLDSLLRECIYEVNDLENLYFISKISAEIKASNQDYLESFISIENQFSIIFQGLFIDFLSKRSDEKAIFISRYISKFSKLGFDIQESSDWFCDNIIEFICDKNKINDDYEWNLEVNIHNDYKMIENLKKCKLSEKKYVRLKKIEDILNRVELKKIMNNQIKPFSQKLCKKTILIEDLNNIHLISYRLASNESSFITASVYKAYYKGNEVLVKEYVINDEIMLKSQESILKTINSEILAYEILDKVADSSNYLCKYYGCIIEDHSYSIVINFFRQNLMRLMNDPTFLSQPFAKHNNFPRIVKTLIHSFALMHEKNIYHGNVSPYSLLVDDNLNLCIIDSSFSYIRFDEISKNYFTGNEFFQDNQGYEPPEMKNKDSNQMKGTYDVYSLGLVFLQLATSKNVEDFENHPEKYYNEVEKLNMPWFVLLLRNMLTNKPDDRLKFQDLARFVEAEITENTTFDACSIHSLNLE